MGESGPLDELLRGLAADPDERYGSMQELLVELGAVPEQVHRTGELQRTLLIIAGGAFAALWAPAVLGFDLAITYRLHYVTDLGLLAIIVIGGLLARGALARSRFNREIYTFGLTAAVGVVALAAGGDLLGIDPLVVGTLHLLVAGVVSFGVAATLDRRMGVIAATYFAAFFAAARWPGVFLLACAVSHALLAAGLLVIFQTRARSHRA